MALDEKRAWITAVVSACGYVVYLVIVLSRAAGDVPLADVAYVAPLLWTVGAAIVVTIGIGIATGLASPREAMRTDERDREIDRFGEYVGHSFVVIGGVATLVMAMAETAHFWIANTVYLMFALSAIVGSVARIFAYRRGFQQW
ncbi:hypothetical protein [Actinophytocola gossypii]|uniref:DUF2178 domain-containing protein n=1 Tax=Actinophytocola gossypii TaxID=2812003 RepID=A0ABT2JBE6_9PSEU|nr:hypothetical protein [Actinophytocola gossypii]MCT2585093.1 hypothetical protein [Actinophytocola gossypii]